MPQCNDDADGGDVDGEDCDGEGHNDGEDVDGDGCKWLDFAPKWFHVGAETDSEWCQASYWSPTPFLLPTICFTFKQLTNSVTVLSLFFDRAETKQRNGFVRALLLSVIITICLNTQ